MGFRKLFGRKGKFKGFIKSEFRQLLQFAGFFTPI